jgi:hypothetical protein
MAAPLRALIIADNYSRCAVKSVVTRPAPSDHTKCDESPWTQYPSVSTVPREDVNVSLVPDVA